MNWFVLIDGSEIRELLLALLLDVVFDHPCVDEAHVIRVFESIIKVGCGLVH